MSGYDDCDVYDDYDDRDGRDDDYDDAPLSYRYVFFDFIDDDIG
jgi:hypothetical protein